MQVAFAENVATILKDDPTILGLAVGGSWLNNEIDQWSDLDLIIVTHEPLNADKSKMTAYANRFGRLISAFTGDHVGERRLLICLYNEPLIHVDLKFLTLEEFQDRVEDPVILLDTDRLLQQVITTTAVKYPKPDFQWIEDRFWTWVHYALLKIGRGEYLEALDFMSYLRMVVFGPLLHIKNQGLPRGVRKVEFLLPPTDLQALTGTLSLNDKASLLQALKNAVELYRSLREHLFDKGVSRNKAEDTVMHWLETSRFF